MNPAPRDHSPSQVATDGIEQGGGAIAVASAQNEMVNSPVTLVLPRVAGAYGGLATPTRATTFLADAVPQRRPARMTRRAQPPPETRTHQPTLSQQQARDIARVIMRRDVKLWHEINAPSWTLRRLYGDDFPFPLPGPANKNLLDHTVESLRAWRNISTTAVITTRKPYIDRVYRRLKRDLPNMQIIPGLKLSNYLPTDAGEDFLADHSVWEAFTVDALRCAEITGTRQIVIMAEGPMAKFYSGKYTPNVGKFTDAMAPLRESGLRVIWYPFGPHGRRPISDGVRLVEGILKAVPNSWFPSVGDGFPFREKDVDQNARRKAQLKATKGQMVHHVFAGQGKGLWVYQSGKSKQAYSPVEFLSWLNRRALGGVWVYPGTFNGKALGEELQALLIPDGFRIAGDPRDP